MSDNTILYLVVGLGNPGRQFTGNRHNLGKMIVTALARDLKLDFSERHPKADLARTVLKGKEVILATLTDYMNSSGFGVDALRLFYGIELNNLIIVHDDLDLELGEIRIKKGGGSGGHNGLKSIIDIMDTDQFVRVRVGIGRPPGKKDPAEYVLDDFTVVQFAELEFVLNDALEAVKMIVADGVGEAMNRYNKR